jgi:dCMP deaminase
MKNKWENAYMKCAETFSDLSYCERLKVGAVVVKDNRIISIGYNGTPKNWINVCEDEFGKTKDEVIHAEMNCITKLAQSNESGKGAHMFITHSPCIVCAKAIYGSGISKVFYKHEYRDSSGVEFLKRCNIFCEKLDSSGCV